MANQQGALFWALRAATSLARLHIDRQNPKQARKVLAPVYGGFTEGFETPDMRAAQELLDSLPAS